MTEEQLDDVRTQSSVRAAELVSLSDRLAEAQRNTEELTVRLEVSEANRTKLRTDDGGEPKVGFSAGLTNAGLVGPFDEETTLIFTKTITNLGQGYNQSSGVFTAPVRGFYYFSFTAADFLKGYMGLYLFRNDQPIVFSLGLNDHGGYTSTSNSVALQLDKGDRVRLSLPASYRLYDDSRNFSVFSGFLLFPL
nr:complement C1q-like protein 2 [Nothobranchius furzeri]